MNFKILIFIFIVVNISNVHAYDNSIVTNIYSQVAKLYEGHKVHGNPVSSYSRFLGVRGGGINNEFFDDEIRKFTNLVEIVSNNCASIAANWRTYETNEMVRFTVLSAVGYSGYDNYTNFLNTVITPSCSLLYTNRWATVKFMLDPYGTEMEHQLALNYENPIVSNIVQRIKAESVLQSNTNYVNWCSEILSGEWKRWYLDMKMSGAL